MVGLLGIAAAGAARGARDVSNQRLQATNDALREDYARKYGEEQRQQIRAENRVDNAEASAAAAAAKEQEYQRSRADKLSDRESDQKFRADESQKNRDSARSVAAIRSNRGSGGSAGADGELDERLLPSQGSLAQKVNVYLQVNKGIDRSQALAQVQREEFMRSAMSSSMAELDPQFVSRQMDAYDSQVQANQGNAIGNNDDTAPRARKYNPATGKVE